METVVCGMLLFGCHFSFISQALLVHTGAKFEVVVVSTQFDGVALVDRSRMVHDALGADVMGKIHALSIKAWTPAQYETKKSSLPANYKPAQ